MDDLKSFILNGRTYTLYSFSEEINEFFQNLFLSYFGNKTFEWNKYKNEINTFLLTTPNRNSIHNHYFNNFTPIWNHLLNIGNFYEAQLIWQFALEPILIFEKMYPDREIHKGTAYYFWGMTSLLAGDLDKGFLLMHQAVEEDVKTSNQHIPDTPAMAFANLNSQKLDQAFRQWVVHQANILDQLIRNYSEKYSRNFTLDNFRNKLLNDLQNLDITFLFVYTLAKLEKINNVPVSVLKSRFSSQLLLNLLFDFSFVIETAIRAKNPSGRSFINHANFLTNSINQVLSEVELGDINQNFKVNFETTLSSILDQSYKLSNSLVLTEFQTNIAVTYGIRNKGAHDITSSEVVREKFHEIIRAILNTLFCIIDYLY